MRSRWKPQSSEVILRLMKECHADSVAINMAVAELMAGHEAPGSFHRHPYHRLHVGLYRVHCIADGDILNVVRIDKVLEP